MAEPPAELEREASVDVAQVLRAVGAQAETERGLPDRIVIEQATEREWAYRLYYRGDPDFAGGILTL